MVINFFMGANENCAIIEINLLAEHCRTMQTGFMVLDVVVENTLNEKSVIVLQFCVCACKHILKKMVDTSISTHS